ncbi:hypothetical protein [Salsuginibacillus kocurii]|uniref:hypothetical protein n=1 Tax=Salsuginibacillus kocurii TaxID=427078 RepID=UPI00036ED125|nr:hypothetical protein [Salsuginibacillus kocurii]
MKKRILLISLLIVAVGYSTFTYLDNSEETYTHNIKKHNYETIYQLVSGEIQPSIKETLEQIINNEEVTVGEQRLLSERFRHLRLLVNSFDQSSHVKEPEVTSLFQKPINDSTSPTEVWATTHIHIDSTMNEKDINELDITQNEDLYNIYHNTLAMFTTYESLVEDYENSREGSIEIKDAVNINYILNTTKNELQEEIHEIRNTPINIDTD